MNVLDKFLDAIKLNDDYDEYDDEFFDDDDIDEFEDEKPRKRFFKKIAKEEEDLDFDMNSEPLSSPKKKTAAGKAEKATTKAVKPAKSSSKITPMRAPKKAAAGMEVCVSKPSSMEDTREIADNLIEGCTVILNLEGLDVELAQRIIDFCSGACYSLGGSLQKVASYIFILTPASVELSGDFQSILGKEFDLPSIRTDF